MARGSLHRHSFSIEMARGRNINKLLIPGGSSRALIEGELGENISVEIVEGVLLQISGNAGVFRLDLDEGESELVKTQIWKTSISPNRAQEDLE